MCKFFFFFPLYKHDLRTEWKTNLFDTEQRAGFSCDSICGPLFSFAFVVLAHHDIFCPFSLPALFLCLTTQLKKKKERSEKPSGRCENKKKKSSCASSAVSVASKTFHYSSFIALITFRLISFATTPFSLQFGEQHGVAEPKVYLCLRVVHTHAHTPKINDIYTQTYIYIYLCHLLFAVSAAVLSSASSPRRFCGVWASCCASRSIRRAPTPQAMAFLAASP